MPASRNIPCAIVAIVLANVAWAQHPDPPSPMAYQTADPVNAHPCRSCGLRLPLKGWVLAGSAPQDYAVNYQTEGLPYSSNLSYVPGVTELIASKPDAKGDGFGTIMQTISAEDYRGQRVRFSALLRPHDVAAGAGLWFRVDGADGKILAFDNMQSRPVLGTQNWKRYDVVVDVPESGTRIAYGVLLISKGELGIDQIHFDKVGRDVATTSEALPQTAVLPKAPVNLELKQR